MQLICPNCDARYEVPDDAIPEGGRDVQCSSCGHAWFQQRPEAEIAAEEEAALFGDDLPKPTEALPATEAPPVAEASPAAEADTESATPDDTDAALAAAVGAAVAGASGSGVAAEAEAEMAAEAEPAPPPPVDLPADHSDDLPPKQELDDSVLVVLREEAEREAEARRAEAQKAGAKRADAEGQMQFQPDLGVDAAPPAAAALSPTQRRLAMLMGKDPDAPPPEPAKPAARRDLLPDVEEINSTLRPSDDQSDPDAEVDALPDLTKGRRGFRSGFFLMILLAVIAAAVYMAAPKLITQFPALEGGLTAYVTFVDGLRLWLNDLMNSATSALKGDGG